MKTHVTRTVLPAQPGPPLSIRLLHNLSWRPLSPKKSMTTFCLAFCINHSSMLHGLGGGGRGVGVDMARGLEFSLRIRTHT